jgi:transcriptional regulator with XRE-family HTH domain
MLLIKARIARRWSQRQLADVLGIAEQQVQRYESTDYPSASLARICDIAAALDVTITERLSLRGPHAA